MVSQASRLNRLPAAERGITIADFLVPVQVGERISARVRHIALILSGALLVSLSAQLTIFQKGQTIPQFEKALLSLKVGETSHPVATQFGYHIIKLNDRTTGAPLSFEDAKDQVKEQIQVEKKRKRFDELVASLRAKAKLRVADVPIPISEVPAASPASGTP